MLILFRDHDQRVRERRARVVREMVDIGLGLSGNGAELTSSCIDAAIAVAITSPSRAFPNAHDPPWYLTSNNTSFRCQRIPRVPS